MKERNAPSVCMCLVTGTRYPQFAPSFRFSALFQLTKANHNEWLKKIVKVNMIIILSPVHFMTASSTHFIRGTLSDCKTNLSVFDQSNSNKYLCSLVNLIGLVLNTQKTIKIPNLPKNNFIGIFCLQI